MREDIQSTLNIIVENVKIITSKVQELSETSSKMLNRIDILEDDLKERSIKKNFYKSLFTFYPLILVALMYIFGANHTEATNTLKTVNDMILENEKYTKFLKNDG